MVKIAKLAGALLIVFVGLQARAATVRAADDDLPSFKVVMLRSSNALSSAAIIQDQQMREALERTVNGSVQFFVEILDTIDFNGAVTDKEFLALFKKKYRGQRVDLMLAVGRDALTFAQCYREQLLPGVPIMFYNVADDFIQKRPLESDVAGVFLKFDVAGTLDLALRLQPRARQLVVIGGTAEYDKNWLRRAREALAPHQGKLNVAYFNELTFPKILEKVKQLPPDTIVLYLSMARDAAGRAYPSHSVVKQISEASRAPVYGVMDSNLGQGIVGGVMPSFAFHGKMAGELAARLLAGETAHPIAPLMTTAQPFFDWRQLKRWELDEQRLTANSLILYRQATLWQQYRWHILGAAVALVLESLLIVALLVQLRRRKRAESAVQAQYSELADLNKLLAKSIAKNRAMLDALPDIIFTQTLNGVYVDYHCGNPGDLLLAPENFLGDRKSTRLNSSHLCI